MSALTSSGIYSILRGQINSDFHMHYNTASKALETIYSWQHMLKLILTLKNKPWLQSCFPSNTKYIYLKNQLSSCITLFIFFNCAGVALWFYIYLLCAVTCQSVSQVSAECTLPNSSFSRQYEDLVLDCWQLHSYLCYSCRKEKRKEDKNQLLYCEHNRNRNSKIENKRLSKYWIK